MQVFVRRLMRVASMLALSTLCSLAVAQQPPIHMLVGFPPGGTTDVLARLLAERMSATLDRNIIVENRPGASGMLAASRLAQSAPDGNTLLFVASTHATNASLYEKLPYDTVRDFRAVGLVAVTPYVLVVNPQLPVNSLSQFVEHLQDHPGEVEFASASPGTGQHLAGELFKAQADVNILHVPYKGSSAAMPDLISGRVPMMFDNIAVMLPYINEGTLRPLAITSKARSSLLPSIPTVTESGFKNFEVLGWFALMAGSNVSDDVIASLSEGLKDAVADPQFGSALERLGAESGYRTPEETDVFIKEEVAKWGRVITEADIKIN